MFQQPTAPASIGGVLDNGFKLFSACFTSVFGLALLSGLVSQLTSFVLLNDTDPATGLPEFGGTLIVAYLVSVFLSMWLYAAIVARIHAIYCGQPMAIGASLSFGLTRLLPLVFWLIAYFLALVGGLILLVVPGIILGVSLAFASYAVVIERTGAVESLKASHRLVWGHWWRTAALLTIAAFILFVVYLLVVFVAGIAIALDPELLTSTGLTIADTIVTPLLTGLVTPLFYALTMSAYYDLKLRRSGDDLAARIESTSVTA